MEWWRALKFCRFESDLGRIKSKNIGKVIQLQSWKSGANFLPKKNAVNLKLPWH